MNWKWWTMCGLAALLALGGCGYYLSKASALGSRSRDSNSASRSDGQRVEVTRPQYGPVERTTVQPGTVQSYETVALYARVSGYLKTQTVDIGDFVEAGKVLATIDVPELDKQVERASAALDQANARVLQMNSRVVAARAELAATVTAVQQAEANWKSSEAWLRFRDKQLGRMKDLFALKSIDERLVDETQERFEAATESVSAARSAVATSKARVTADEAKVKQAEADVVAAAAEVKVARAELEKAEVMANFKTIRAPFNGVVTQRSLFPGGFVRAAEGGAGSPLLTVERIDLLRVVVQIPDRDVPFADKHDPVVVEIDALPGQKFPAAISRIARSEDPQTRLMRIEIDLPNPTGKLCQGMYGRVRIVLETEKRLTLPSSCLVDKTEGGKGSVYVVRDGRARLTEVRLGADDGLRVAILDGLTGDDLVVLNPSGGLRDDTAVTPNHTEP